MRIPIHNQCSIYTRGTTRTARINSGGFRDEKIIRVVLGSGGLAAAEGRRSKIRKIRVVFEPEIGTIRVVFESAVDRLETTRFFC